MKTAVSIPDDIFKQAERLANRQKKSRSALYQEAVAEYVARHDPDEVTAAMNHVTQQLDTRPDVLISEAANQVLKNTEW